MCSGGMRLFSLCACVLVQVVNETLPALHALKAKGLVRHVGFSCLPLPLIKRVVEKAKPGTCCTAPPHCTLSDTVSHLFLFFGVFPCGLCGFPCTFYREPLPCIIEGTPLTWFSYVWLPMKIVQQCSTLLSASQVFLPQCNCSFPPKDPTYSHLHSSLILKFEGVNGFSRDAILLPTEQLQFFHVPPPLPVTIHAGDVDVVLSYCHNSLNDSSLLDLIPSLGDIGLISASPMSMGLLTPQVCDPSHARQHLTQMRACPHTNLTPTCILLNPRGSWLHSAAPMP